MTYPTGNDHVVHINYLPDDGNGYYNVTRKTIDIVDANGELAHRMSLRSVAALEEWGPSTLPTSVRRIYLDMTAPAEG